MEKCLLQEWLERVEKNETTEKIPPVNEIDYIEQNEHFSKILGAYVPKPKNPVNVLNMACGCAWESKSILDYFEQGSTLTGIDFDSEQIKEAIESNSRYGVPPSDNFKLVKGDCRSLETMVKNIDITIIRHAYILECFLPVANMFTSANNVMKKNGLILATTLVEDEFKEVKRCLNATGYELQLAEENKHKLRIVRHPNKKVEEVLKTKKAYYDKYIIIGTKN